MNLYIIIKYAHILSIFGMLSSLVAELALIRNQLSRSQMTVISKLDGLYGLTSILAVGAGFALWFGVGKPAEFYNNPVFHVKLSLAILVGLISIIPTVFFVKNRKGDPNQQVLLPNHIRPLIILQLTLLGVIPLFAVMMANGIRF